MTVTPASARLGFQHASEIAATGYAYPRLVVDNDEYFARCRFRLSVERSALERDTAMKTRYWCDVDEDTWTLARDAISMALSEDPALRDEIDLVVVASGTTFPVMYPPDHDRAGFSDLAPLAIRDFRLDGALGLDIKACYCTGFLRALQVADALLAQPAYRAALVVATEQGSKLSVAESNRSSFCFIIGDSAGAVVLRRTSQGEGSGRGLIDYAGHTHADKFDWAGIGPDGKSIMMKGAAAATATHELLVAAARTVMDRNGLGPADIDWLLPIQTHAVIMERARSALGWPADKVLWAGDVTGFSGSSSIPACLADQLRNGPVRPGDLVLAVAVGGGMNNAATLFRC